MSVVIAVIFLGLCLILPEDKRLSKEIKGIQQEKTQAVADFLEYQDFPADKAWWLRRNRHGHFFIGHDLLERAVKDGVITEEQSKLIKTGEFEVLVRLKKTGPEIGAPNGPE